MRVVVQSVLACLLAASAFACIGAPEPQFERMVKDATLIVRGQVLSETGDSHWNDRGTKQHWSELLIERTYKGEAPSEIRVGWKEYNMCSRARLQKGDYALLFLKRDGSNLVLAEEQYGKLAVSRWQDDTPTADPLKAIESDLKRAIQNDSGRELIDDVSLLGSLRRPMDTSVVRALLPTDDGILESTVHLALLKLKDYSRLAAAGKLVETVKEERSFKLPEEEAGVIRTHIGSEIRRIQDENQLPLLQRFTLSSNSWLRQNAAYAVRQMHAPSSIRYLIRLVDDPSEEARIHAMWGLQEIVKPGVEGEGWVPRWEGSKQVGQAEAAARWHQWWDSEGKSKYGPPLPDR